MKRYERKSVMTELKKFCVISKEHDFMEITEWANGEGFDVNTSDKSFNLTFGEFKALKKLVKALTHEKDS